MTNPPCLIIQCIFPGKYDTKDRLLIALQKNIQCHWPNARIVLRSYADYPKIEDDKKVVYGLIHSPIIPVRDLINIFPVTWDYSESMIQDVDSQKIYNEQKAFWSQLCHPN